MLISTRLRVKILLLLNKFKLNNIFCFFSVANSADYEFFEVKQEIMEEGEVVDLVAEDQENVQSETVVPADGLEGHENEQLEGVVSGQDATNDPAIVSCCKGCENCSPLTLRQLYDKGILGRADSKVSFAHDPESSRFHLRLCRLCQGDFNSFEALHAHVDVKHVGTSTLDIIEGIEKTGDCLRCPFCPHYETLTQLLRHLIEEHSNGFNFSDVFDLYKKDFCDQPVQIWLWDKVMENCALELHAFAEELIEKNLQGNQNV